MSGSKLIIGGMIATLVFIVFVLIAGFSPYCAPDAECVSNFRHFWKSPPNEKGDALAGIAGSLAFLWIIITVLLQSKELGLQRQELAQTRNTLEKQTGFLSLQDEDRARAKIDQTIEAKIAVLKNEISQPDFEKIDTVFADRPNTLNRGKVSWITNKQRRLGMDNEALSASFRTFVKNSKLWRANGEYLVKPDLTRWTKIRNVCDEIIALTGRATPAMQDRVTRLEHVDELHEAISEALAPEIWDLPSLEPTS